MLSFAKIFFCSHKWKRMEEPLHSEDTVKIKCVKCGCEEFITMNYWNYAIKDKQKDGI